jgi:hypothetical protein
MTAQQDKELNFIDQLKQEWLATKQPHVPLRTFDEIERETQSNYAWMARVQEEIGRPLHPGEIADMTM